MKKVKESSGILAAVAIILTLMGYMSSTYATKELCEISSNLISINKVNINTLEMKTNNIGAILCGIAIDLKLPTARKECNIIITN